VSLDLREERSSIYVTTVTEPVSANELEKHLTQCSDLFFRRAPFVQIFRGFYADPLDTSCREIHLEWIRQNRTHLEAHCQGMGFVLLSNLEHGTVAALQFAARPPYSLRVFDEFSGALTWAEARLAEYRAGPSSIRGLSPTVSMRAGHTEPPESGSRSARGTEAGRYSITFPRRRR
jgi:hypothetical protein